MTVSKRHVNPGQAVFRKIVKEVIDENRQLWTELKDQFACGAMPDLFGSGIGIAFQQDAEAKIRAIAQDQRRLLTSFVVSIPTDARSMTCSEAVVAAIMKRAKAATHRAF